MTTPDDIGIKPAAWRVSNAGKVWNFRRTSSGGLGWRHAEPVYSDTDVRAALAAEKAKGDEDCRIANELMNATIEDYNNALARIAVLEAALREIRDYPEPHTKLNQERLCCKFQHIAAVALGEEHSNGNG